MHLIAISSNVISGWAAAVSSDLAWFARRPDAPMRLSSGELADWWVHFRQNGKSTRCDILELAYAHAANT
eukprot:3004131-Karenia_brevis.AAC.1